MVVNRPSDLRWLPRLILAICAVVICSRMLVQNTVSPGKPSAVSNGWLRDVQPPSRIASYDTNPAVDARGDDSVSPIATVESSWGRELRELKELAAVAPDAALARVARMPEKHERKSAAQVVCLIVAGQDPAKAMLAAWSNDLGKFTDESTEGAAVEILAKRWAEADLAKAFVWASALPADDEARRDRVVKGIALALVQVAPADAAAMVANHIDADSSVHIDAAIEILRAWATQEYPGAMAWASLFPAGPIRERGFDELATVVPGQFSSEPKPN